MFEQELEMEKKEGSSLGPVLVIFLMVALFIGGIGVVVYQTRLMIKPEEASAVVESKLKAMAPVTVTFHTGNVSYDNFEKPSDPQYKLLEKAGFLKVVNGKNYTAQVDLTPAGKEFIASLPDVKGVTDPKDKTTAYKLVLASRKMASIGKIVKLGQDRFQVQYTWAWQPTKAGDLFDISGKLVQSLPIYERSQLIDQHGANYYHSAPIQASIMVIKGDKGWEPASAN